MSQASIEREIHIDAPIDVGWDVITQPEHLAKWFADEAVLDLRAGGAGTLTFTEQGHATLLRVETVNPPHVFSYRWSQPDGEEPPEDNSMLVEFTLTEINGSTTLRLVESGFNKVSWSDEKNQQYYDDHTNGWDYFVPRLGTYVVSAQSPSK